MARFNFAIARSWYAAGFLYPGWILIPVITKTLLDESCMDLKSVTPSRTFILEDYEMHHWGRHDSVIFENCQFKIHVIIGILTRFSIRQFMQIIDSRFTWKLGFWIDSRFIESWILTSLCTTHNCYFLVKDYSNVNLTVCPLRGSGQQLRCACHRPPFLHTDAASSHSGRRNQSRPSTASSRCDFPLTPFGQQVGFFSSHSNLCM